jgi:hypothetical protein
MIPFAAAVDDRLTALLEDALAALDGVPEHDLNHWTPQLGLEGINTFFALATHLAGAGEYWLLHAAAGQPTDRVRAEEFHATGSVADLRRRFERWLADCRVYLATVSEADLARVFERGGADPVRRTVADCILHAVEHTGVHVGHLQIQRQIWNAERGAAAR